MVTLKKLLKVFVRCIGSIAAIAMIAYVCALGVNCMAAPVVEPGHLAAVGVVIPAPRVRSRAREALVASAGRISRALALR